MSHTPSVSPGFTLWVAEIVHRHRGRLLSYVRRRGLAAEDALDVVQDSFAAFLTLPQAHSIARVGDDAIKLLTVIARHNILNLRRKRATRETGLDINDLPAIAETESHEDLLGRAEELTRVYGCLLRMSRLQRAAILLSTLDDHPSEDVSDILGVSPGHLRVLLHRARAHVRACSLDEMPAVSARALRDSLEAS